MKENNVVTSEANRKLCQGWEHDDFQRKQCTNQKNRPFGLLCFCNLIVRIRFNRKNLVEWLDFIHNFLIVNYKVTKNLPFDLFI